MSTKKNVTETPPSRLIPAVPANPLRAAALADPVLQMVQGGALVDATYDAAWDAIETLLGEGSYVAPTSEVQDYLRRNWEALLAEPAPVSAPTSTSKRGRPTLLTPELLAQIEAAAEDGVKDAQIYAELGIAKQTWSRWLELEHFREAIAAARARLARRMMKLIPTMEKGWQAPVWVLTQLFPGDYSRPNAETEINVNASANATAASSAVTISPAVIAKMQDRRRQALKGQMTRAMEK